MRVVVPFSIMINQDIKCSFLLVWSQILSLCAGFLVFFFAGLTIDVWLFCVGPDDMYILILRVEGVSSRFLFSGLCKLEWFVVHWDLLILFWSFLNMQCIVWNYLYFWIYSLVAGIDFLLWIMLCWLLCSSVVRRSVTLPDHRDDDFVRGGVVKGIREYIMGGY